MNKERTGFINDLNSIEELTTARCQASRDDWNVAEIVATVLGHHDCDGVAIVALEMALHEYFYNTVYAYDREVDRRLSEICNTAAVMSVEED